MANGDQTQYANGNSDIKSVLADMARKQGPLFVVLIAMGYFIFKVDQRNEQLLPLLGKNNLLIEQAIKQGEKNNQVIERATGVMERVERRLERNTRTN